MGRGVNAMDKGMEAKVRELVTLKSEWEFFDLIEKKMKEQGFEVLETLSTQKKEKPRGKAAQRFVKHLAY